VISTFRVDSLHAFLRAKNWYSQFIDFDFTPTNVNVFTYGSILGTTGSAVPSEKIIHIYNFLSGSGD